MFVNVPVSSQEAQTGRADLVAEHIEIQARFIFVFWSPYVDRAQICLVDDPPFLDLIWSVVGSFQSQSYVEMFFI